MRMNLGMTTKKKMRKKRKFNPTFKLLRHPLLPFGFPDRRIAALATLLLVLAVGVNAAAATPEPQQTGSHAHDFVIFANVFNEQGFALPGAKVRVRLANEQKYRWEAISDRRGELGIRVPQGAEYELTVEARGCKSQTRKIDARNGNREDLTLQMESLAGGKS
jgi:carboxypeptidase family protein